MRGGVCRVEKASFGRLGRDHTGFGQSLGCCRFSDIVILLS